MTPHLKPSAVIKRAGILVALLTWSGVTHAQFNVGLYKDGQLVDTFTPVAPLTNAAGQFRAAAPGAPPSPTSVAPAVSEETQQRNQLFAESARIGEAIREAVLQGQTSASPSPLNGERAGVRGEASPSLAGVRGDLADLLQQFLTVQTQARAALEQTGLNLIAQGVPPEIFQRHLDMLASFDTGLAVFTNVVNEVLLGRPGATQRATDYLSRVQFRHQPDLTKLQPTQQAQPIVPAPELTREQADARLRDQATVTGQLFTAASASAPPRHQRPRRNPGHPTHARNPRAGRCIG
jgi:hypothetical protein